jgi:hypothetical protein
MKQMKTRDGKLALNNLDITQTCELFTSEWQFEESHAICMTFKFQQQEIASCLSRKLTDRAGYTYREVIIIFRPLLLPTSQPNPSTS